MSWQLAVVVLVPMLGGVAIGKAAGNATLWVLIGLAVAILGSGLVMWRTAKVANSLPVPKLTPAQKREIQKSYEAEDDD